VLVSSICWINLSKTSNYLVLSSVSDSYLADYFEHQVSYFFKRLSLFSKEASALAKDTLEV